MYYDEAEEYFYGYDISTDKGYDNFIKKLVVMCRNTPEYRVWSKNCKLKADEEMEFVCPICNTEYEYSPIESHHHPKTLYEICDYHVQKYIQSGTLNDDETSPIMLIKEVMDRHLDNKVSYINLCKSCHEKHHAGDYQTTNRMDEIMKKRKEEKTLKGEI